MMKDVDVEIGELTWIYFVNSMYDNAQGKKRRTMISHGSQWAVWTYCKRKYIMSAHELLNKVYESDEIIHIASEKNIHL